MGTKELRWSSAQVFPARCIALALTVASLAILATAAPVFAADAKKVRDKIVDLNKQALLSYEAKDFDTAKDLLNKALKEAKQAGLDDDKMTARTYLHLGAVYFTGYQDQASAIQNFTAAKKIRPDIQLTPSIETPELKAVFDQATAEAEPAAPSESSRAVKAQPLVPESTSETESSNEPELPSRMSAPLMCSTPEEAAPGKDLSIRCAVKPGVNAKTVELHYRAPGAESYQALPMRRTDKGWYVATIPGHVIKGQSIQVYYDARDSSDNEVASNGQIDSPSVVEIRKRGSGGGAGGEGDPLANIKKQQQMEQYESGLHRRRQGAFYVAPGIGMGWGYAPAGNLEWENNIKVTAITTTTGLFHALLDFGYMLTDNFAISLQGRLEYIRQDQAANVSRSGAPTTYAPALLLRSQWFYDMTSGGNLQFSAGPSVGGGFVRFPVRPVAKTTVVNGQTVPDEKNTIAKTDTRPMGVVLVGGGAGFIYHISRHFSLTLDGRALLGFPDFGFAVEGDIGFLVAFGGKAGPGQQAEEEGEGETGAVRDEPPTEPSGSEEE